MNSKLGYGLNKRKKKGGGLSGFGGESSDDDSASGGDKSGGRSAINKKLLTEQEAMKAALRKRAEAAMKEASNSALYDYDGEYDSFSSGKKKEEQAKADAARRQAERNQPKSSKYIGNLLKTSQRRNQEQEIIYEHKVAKEQAKEEMGLDFEGKEKFVTSGYKRKLAEREQWKKDEAVRAKREADEDVTKKTGGTFMFGGIGRNLLMGNGIRRSGSEGAGDAEKKSQMKEDEVDRHQQSSYQERRLPSREYSDYRRRPDDSHRRDSTLDAKEPRSNEKNDEAKPKSREEILALRAVKLRDAKRRYFERKGINAR
mmetsp:Transcript_32182/g.76938  ORF Transcript_32182/g.76938 Transcript_32182/m.76938 type:complete len:314 (-) Transcript_32182:25-966(-)